MSENMSLQAVYVTCVLTRVHAALNEGHFLEAERLLARLRNPNTLAGKCLRLWKGRNKAANILREAARHLQEARERRATIVFF